MHIYNQWVNGIETEKRDMANVLTFNLTVEQSLIATSMAELKGERTRFLEEYMKGLWYMMLHQPISLMKVVSH